MTKYPPTRALTTRVLIGTALALGLGTGQALAETATGTMLSDTCAGCHGTYGNSQGPAIPSIAAMAPVIFVETMQGYRDDSIYSTVMGRIARGYSDEEIEKMAEYFNQQEFVPARQSFDSSLVDTGASLHERYCESCHVDGGGVAPEEEDYWILAGQWTPYLEFTIEDFLEERREMERKMKTEIQKMLKSHGEDAWAALWAYYASQQ